VLSIGKLAVGQADYYLEQAHGAVTRAGALRSGVEDYYVGGPEAAGVWVGGGVRALRLSGEVDAVRLDRVLGGAHPATEEPLGRVVRGRVPGFDLTFSAPKSVSVLFGGGEDRVREAIRDAHDRAVEDALRYVERAAGVSRRGAGGAEAVGGRGLVAAAIRHRTSRAGDPQLHTHVLVANLILGADGRWGTVDGRRVYAHAKTAGFLYEMRLRARLSRELGLEWGEVRNGIADVVDVSPTVRRAFSRRRAEIEAELARRGAASPGAAQVAALTTRRAKDYRVAPERLAPEWRERAAGLGLDDIAVRNAIERKRPPSVGDVEPVLARLGGPDGLTADRSSFTRREALQALAAWLPVGADVTIEDLEQLTDRFLGSERVVVLADGEPAREVVGVDGRVVSGVPSERRYSTPELLGRERQILEFAAESRGAQRGVGRDVAVARAIRRRPTIGDEQAEMVRRLVLDGDGVAVVIGQAGTGKTYALGAAREAWEFSGQRVVGAALARRAAIELEDGAGIESTSVAALIEELRRWPGRVLTRRSVLVIDEAGMVPTRMLAEVVGHVERAGARLVLVGDDRQLPEIGAGGAFQALARRLPAIELRENRRQLAVWEREALALVRAGDADQAVREYELRGRVVVDDDANALKRRLVADWWRAGDTDGAVMIAHRRRDVADLNGRAHALLLAAGYLSGEELVARDVSLAVGDRVLIRRNDRRLGVVNGERGEVVAVDVGGRTAAVRLRGREVVLDREFVDGGSLSLGYAITGHAAQGVTCSRTFVLASEGLSKEWAYVALSRGSESNRLYVTRERRDRLEYAPADRDVPRLGDELRAGLTRSAAQTLAIDQDAELEAARAELTTARERWRELDSRRRPRWFRPAARERHAADLREASVVVDAAVARTEELRRRHQELWRERSERVVTMPERVDRSLERRIDRGIDGIGL
jgi:conjugative relaxase-like TrwC/TraI family protein